MKNKLLEALKDLLPVAENWSCYCEINGEGKNNPAANIVKHAKLVIEEIEE